MESQNPPSQAPPPAHPLLRGLDRFLARYLSGLLPEEKRYWVLVPLTGLAAGLFAVGFVKLLDLVQGAAWGRSADLREGAMGTSPWLRVAIPILAGLTVAILVPFLGKKKVPAGTSGLIESLALKKGILPTWRTILKGIVSIFSVGMGASLGREGALIQSGAAFGSYLGAKFHLKEHHVKVLLAGGAAGGMAAAYNVPIGASVFAMEVLLGSFALDLFGPIIICSVIATSVSRALISDDPVYQIHTCNFQSWEIFLHMILGIFLGLVSIFFIRFFSGLNVLFRWLERADPIKPLLVMAALGLGAIYFPDILGNGYGTVNLVLKGDVATSGKWFLEAGDKFSLKLLLFLPALKMLFTALCKVGGIPGGLFTPSLFVGALLGSSFGLVAGEILPWQTSPPGAYALIGMGAILAGTMHAPITAILLVFELTNDASVILPLMAACIASSLVSHVFQQGSLFTEPLRRKGIFLPTAIAPTWLREPLVEELTDSEAEAEAVHVAERFDQVVDRFLQSPLEHNRLYVTDREGCYAGAISLHEIKLFFRESMDLDPVIAMDILDPSFPFVCLKDPISRAIEILADTDADRLPVLEDAVSRRLRGTISRRRLLAAYRMSNLMRIEAGK